MIEYNHGRKQNFSYIIIACALTSEMNAFYTQLSHETQREKIYENQRQCIEKICLQSMPCQLILVRSGVGIANAASAAAFALFWARSQAYRVKAYISTGTCGGMYGKVAVGDLVLGDSYTHLKADATAFGYALGQIPDMPVSYHPNPSLLQLAHNSCPKARSGGIVSSDAFITASEITSIQKHFPETIAADMESAAIAQVCWNEAVPFISIRCVSDLCSKPEHAKDDFEKGEINASLLSAQSSLAVLQSLNKIEDAALSL